MGRMSDLHIEMQENMREETMNDPEAQWFNTMSHIDEKITLELLHNKGIWEHMFWTLQTELPPDIVKQSFYNYVLSDSTIKKHNSRFENNSNELSFPNAKIKPKRTLKNSKVDSTKISFSTIYELFPGFLEKKIIRL